MKDKKGKVYLVHCVDTEGPLYEDLRETFKRIAYVFGIKNLEPTKENLQRLQHKQIDLGGLESEIAEFIHPRLLDYNDHYGRLNGMLEEINDPSFRNRMTDSEGKGWIINWHCVDHVGYEVNPRRKDQGYHNIFDHYRRMVEDYNLADGIHWHFHPSHHRKVSHLNATNYLRDTKFFDILCRRIIDRHWFPSVNRAGFHTERPDSHWLLEQWIPYDYSNQSCRTDDEQADMQGGRFGDWRRAPDDWWYYRPDHDDYQKAGNCRRFIARCLNVGTRFRCVDQQEVHRAFERAEQQGEALLSFTDHDFRDIKKDITEVQALLKQALKAYPDIDIVFCEAREAMLRALDGPLDKPAGNMFHIEANVEENQNEAVRLEVKAEEGTFGPQPFLAVRTHNGEYYHDNFDFQMPFVHWNYTFDQHSFAPGEVAEIGIASNDRYGFVHVMTIDFTSYLRYRNDSINKYCHSTVL